MRSESSGSGEQQPRLSVAAAASAALAVVSLAGCAVVGLLSMLVSPVYFAGVVLLPLLGIGAVILGAIGLRQVRRNPGLVVGRPLAAAGILLGLLSAVVQGSMGGSALATYMSMRSTLAPAAERVFTALSRGDIAGARGLLAPATASSLSDERMRSFIGAVQGACGEVQRAEFDYRVVTEVAQRVKRSGSAAQGPAPGGDPMKPVRLVGTRAEALAWVTLDESALRSGQVRLLDAVVLLPEAHGGGAVALLPDGPGAVLARYLGLKPDERTP